MHQIPRMTLVSVCALSLVATAHAYTPQPFNPAIDSGQDFSIVPANSSAGAISSKYYGDRWGSGYWFSGSALWIGSAAATGWRSSGFMSAPTGCKTGGFGYGHFHWRSQVGYNASQAKQGPGVNDVMWTADNDPNWPGVGAKGSRDQSIGEIDVMETSYADNNSAFATFHYNKNGTAPATNGQVMLNPMIYAAGKTPNDMSDYDVYWGPDHLDQYTDGILQHSAPLTNIPKDGADGGCNYTLGAQLAMQATGFDKLPTAQLLIANMFWNAELHPAAGDLAPAPPIVLLTGSLASPPYAGKNIVSGKGGLAGLRIKGVTTAAHTTPRTAGWVKAVVSRDGRWTAAVVFANPSNNAGTTAHVWAENGAGTMVIDLADATLAPTPVTSALPDSGGFSLASVTEAHGSLLIYGSVPRKGTLREYLDGRYLGTLRDDLVAGPFSFHIADVTPGLHVLMLSLDGYAGTASLSFSK